MPNKALRELTTKIYKIQNVEALRIASKCLRSGQIIALPTDTVYGFACDATNEKAVRQLYAIKDRSCCKPVAICVRDLPTLRMYGKADHLNDALLNNLLPGPTTVILHRTEALQNPYLNTYTNKIGIRIPDFPFIQQVCSVFGESPIALTSANRSSEPSSLHIEEFEKLWPLLGAVFDGGRLNASGGNGLASTVIDLSQNGEYKIIRNGAGLKQVLEILHGSNLKSQVD